MTAFDRHANTLLEWVAEHTSNAVKPTGVRSHVSTTAINITKQVSLSFCLPCLAAILDDDDNNDGGIQLHTMLSVLHDLLRKQGLNSARMCITDSQAAKWARNALAVLKALSHM